MYISIMKVVVYVKHAGGRICRREDVRGCGVLR